MAVKRKAKRKSKRDGPGRPSTFDQAKADIVIDLLAKGNYLNTAIEIAGIPESTIYSWLSGERGKRSPRIRQFVESIKKATSEAERDLLNVVRKAAEGWTTKKTREKYELTKIGEGKDAEFKEIVTEREVIEETKFDWTAAMTILERKFPDKWGRRANSSPPQPPVQPEIDEEFL